MTSSDDEIVRILPLNLPRGVPKPPGVGDHPKWSQRDRKWRTRPRPRRRWVASCLCASVGGQRCPTSKALCDARMV
eukprot:472814-Amphidinium_carterae.2